MSNRHFIIIAAPTKIDYQQTVPHAETLICQKKSKIMTEEIFDLFWHSVSSVSACGSVWSFRVNDFIYFFCAKSLQVDHSIQNFSSLFLQNAFKGVPYLVSTSYLQFSFSISVYPDKFQQIFIIEQLFHPNMGTLLVKHDCERSRTYIYISKNEQCIFINELCCDDVVALKMTTKQDGPRKDIIIVFTYFPYESIEST